MSLGSTLFSSVAVVRHVVEDIFFSLNSDVTVDKEMAEVIGNWNWGICVLR